MVTYDQLSESLHENGCISLSASHHLFSDELHQWLCHDELDHFWNEGYVSVADYINVCEELGIGLFLGKCVVEDGWNICPTEQHHMTPAHHMAPAAHHHAAPQPAVHHYEPVQHHRGAPLPAEHILPEGCQYDHLGQVVCTSQSTTIHLGAAFQLGDCFKVAHQFVCQDDLPLIEQTGCHSVHHTEFCGKDLESLFSGHDVHLSNGDVVHAEFETHQSAHLSNMCRMH